MSEQRNINHFQMQGEQRSILFCLEGFVLKQGDCAVQVQE